MNGGSGKQALHVATFSGWYRFEQNGKEWRQTKRDLSYWTLTCMSVDPEDPKKMRGRSTQGFSIRETRGPIGIAPSRTRRR